MKTKRKRKLLIEQMPGETQEQYLAFLEYCSMTKRSIRKWCSYGAEMVQNSGFHKAEKNKKLPKQTLFSWSKKFQWVKRAKMWDAEKKKLMTLEFQKSEAERSTKVAQLFDVVADNLLDEKTRPKTSTVDDFKKSWEMFRTESGLSTAKTEHQHRINEEEQRIPTEEEAELDKLVGKTLKNYYEQKRKQRSNK